MDRGSLRGPRGQPGPWQVKRLYANFILIFLMASCWPCNATDLAPAPHEQTAAALQQNSPNLLSPVSLRNQTYIASRKNSVFVFGGRLSSSSVGSAIFFNTIPIGTTFSGQLYDNYVVGVAYQHEFVDIGSGFVLGGEIGIADRFGHYVVCCQPLIESSDTRHSGELWFGPTLRYESIILFNQLRIVPGITVGFSLTNDSIGREREREIAYNGSAHFLAYLGTELAFSTVSMPQLELVFRLHHRSGAGGLLGHLREGYNANVAGLRYRF